MKSENISASDASYGCGYQMDIERLNNDEAALCILSQDPGYDIYFMQSGGPFGYKVKEKGSFYPLTSIKGVKEYVDACFPYLKEAATDASGEIWMLPVAVSADSLVYDKEMLDKENINIDSIKNLKSFLKIKQNI